jgi:hypothetical protein
MNEVDKSWPLIRYLVDDPGYFQTYKKYLGEFASNVFNETNLNPLIDKNYNLISPYATGPDGEQPGYSHITNSGAFTGSLPALKTHVRNRNALVNEFLK